MTDYARAAPDRRLRRRRRPGVGDPPRRDDTTGRRRRRPARRGGRPVHGLRLLTWGLLGPGKGIEWAIDAMALLGDVRPRPSYLVAGATHPKVRRNDGEAYRDMLMRRSRRTARGRHGVVRRLVPRPAGADPVDRHRRPRRAAVRLGRSGHLRRPRRRRRVRPTGRRHGVPARRRAAQRRCRDRRARSATRRRSPTPSAASSTDPERLAAMAAECRRLAPELSWPAVARRYDELADVAARSPRGSGRDRARAELRRTSWR